MKRSIRRALVITFVVAPIAVHAALADVSHAKRPFKLKVTASPTATIVPASEASAHRRISLHPTVARQIAQARAEAQTAASSPVVRPPGPATGM